MHSTSDDRLKEVISYFVANGEESTCEHFGFNQETVARYLRESRIRNIESIDINKIDKDKVALLFSWPLIIAKRYLCPYMELDLFKKQCTLNQLLSNDCDLEPIWNYLVFIDFFCFFINNKILFFSII